MSWHAASMARRDEETVRALLGRAYAIVTGPMEGHCLGPVDYAFSNLRYAASKLSLLRPSDVRAVAGPQADAHLDGFHQAISRAEDAYGDVAGPDRTQAQLDGLVRSMAVWIDGAVSAHEALSAALAHVEPYDPSTSPIPSLPSLPPRPAAPQRAPVPSVPPRHPEGRSAQIARRALGMAFGCVGVAVSRYEVRDPDDKHSALLLAGALAEPSARLGAARWSVERRASVEDRCLLEPLSRALDAVDALMEAAMPGRRAGPWPCLRETMLLISGAVREVDALAAGPTVPQPAGAGMAP